MPLVCPNCMNVFQAPPVAPGSVVRCPSCFMGVPTPGLQVAPSPLTRPVPPVVMPPPIPVAAPAPDKACPFCGEIIKAVALKCRYCNETLDPVLRSTQESRRSSAYDPATARLLSFLWPGAGQIYRGDVAEGFLWMLGFWAGLIPCVVPGIIVYVYCIKDASNPPKG